MDKTRGRRSRIGILLITLVAGCGQSRLTNEAVGELVKAHPKAIGLLPVQCEAISEFSSAESIAKVRIGTSTLNLKFRRYNDGWRWEFVETRSGGWVSPDIALADLQEESRQVRVSIWVKAHADAYTATIRTIDPYSDRMPRRTDWPLDFKGWMAGRTLMAKMYRAFSPSPEREREAKAIEGPAMDAWNHEVLIAFDNRSRKAVFVSLGPDGLQSTPDDIVCTVSGRREWDTDYDKIMWNYSKRWTLPEGLQGSVDSAITDSADRSTTFTRIVP